MKKLLFLIILFSLVGCQNLNIYSPKKDYSLIEKEIKAGKIKIEDNKMYYVNEFDLFMATDTELELFKEYAEKHNLEWQ